jgi:hypothetical protein
MANEPIDARRYRTVRLRQVRRIGIEDRAHRIGGGRTLKRAPARHHFVEHRAERDDVRAMA